MLGDLQHAYSETILNRSAKVMAVSKTPRACVCVCVLMLPKQTVAAKYESDGRAAVGEQQLLSGGSDALPAVVILRGGPCPGAVDQQQAQT